MARSKTPHVDLPPDPVIEVYKKDIDRTLLRENLKLTVEQRLRKLQDFADAMRESRGAARRPDADLPPDAVIEAYKRDIDRAMLRNNLRRSVEERLREVMRMEEFAHRLRTARRVS